MNTRIITDKTKKTGVNPLSPCHLRSINPNTDLKADLVIQSDENSAAGWFRSYYRSVPARRFGAGSACAMTGRMVPFFREFVEILAIERENATQTGTMEQTESSDGMIWIFQGKSGKQTDSHSSVLILPVKPFRRLSRLFRCSRFLLQGWRSTARPPHGRIIYL